MPNRSPRQMRRMLNNRDRAINRRIDEKDERDRSERAAEVAEILAAYQSPVETPRVPWWMFTAYVALSIWVVMR